MSLFDFPKANREPALKGYIGMMRRIHYIKEFNDETKVAIGACKKIEGPVDFVGPYTKATCPECIGLLMNRRIKKTVTIERRKISL